MPWTIMVAMSIRTIPTLGTTQCFSRALARNSRATRNEMIATTILAVVR
jgi:hypothetical protein